MLLNSAPAAATRDPAISNQQEIFISAVKLQATHTLASVSSWGQAYAGGIALICDALAMHTLWRLSTHLALFSRHSLDPADALNTEVSMCPEEYEWLKKEEIRRHQGRRSTRSVEPRASTSASKSTATQRTIWPSLTAGVLSLLWAS